MLDVNATDANGDNLTYSIVGGVDAALFTIDSDDGEIRFNSSPDHETPDDDVGNNVYNITVRVSDGTSFTDQTVAITVNDLDEVAPEFTSGLVADAIDENSGAGQVVYTAAATDPSEDGPSNPVSYTLGGTDAAHFTIDATTGEVTLTANPDDETKGSYSFDVTATDGAGNDTTQTVTLGINDLDEVAPEFTSGLVADAIDENSGAGQVVYTAAATDPSEDGPSNPVSYTLGGTDAAHFTIDATTGEVTLKANPDDETKGSYSFDVTATDGAAMPRRRR